MDTDKQKELMAVMSDKEILDAFMSNSMHAGDDFSVHPYDEDDETKGDLLRTEILRRMAST